MKEELQRTSLYQYVPFVLLTTVLLVGLPLFLAYTLSGPSLDFPFLLTTVICTAVSVALGKVGARLWQQHPGARDVVFNDLTLWGFLLRLRHQRRKLANVERLALISSDQQSLSSEEHTRILKQLARALESGDPYTHGHSDRVTRHAYMVARAMKLPKDSCNKIRLAAALHDVGKLHTPRSILTGTGRLSDEEFAIIKRHPGDGAEMVADLQDEELTSMVRYHHERIDGTGYPHQLSGDDIPIGARIIAVADTFDAITSRRPYRATRRHSDAIEILRNEAGQQLDAQVVRAFIAYYTGRRGIRLWMSFTSGAPSLVDFSVAGVRQLASNAAVVAASVSVVAAGAVLPLREAPSKTTTHVSQSQPGTNLNNSVSTLTPLSTGPGAMAKARGAGSAGTKAGGQRAGGPRKPADNNNPGSQPSKPPQGGTDRPGDDEPDRSDPGAGNDGADKDTENDNSKPPREPKPAKPADDDDDGNSGDDDDNDDDHGDDDGNSGHSNDNDGDDDGNSGHGGDHGDDDDGNSGHGRNDDDD